MSRTTLTISLILVSLTAGILLSGCQIATPFKSVAAEVNGLAPDAELLVVVTHATLGPKGRGDFYRQTGMVVDSLKDQPGLIGHSIRRTIAGDKAWTMTIWKDEASMNDFVRGQAHRTAVEKGDASMMDSDFHRFTIPASQARLSWKQAFAKIAAMDGVDYAE